MFHFVRVAFILLSTVILQAHILPAAGMNNKASGRVVYTDGSPAAGVCVTDGFQVCITDRKGRYRISTCPDTWFIYLSLPSDARIRCNGQGRPDFYQRFEKGRKEYDFVLERQPVENRFNIFAVGDIHCHEESYPKFLSQVMPGLERAVGAFSGDPGYIISLGDLINNQNDWNTSDYLPIAARHLGQLPLPSFVTMGNHDYTFYNPENPLQTDEKSSTVDLKWQRLFEEHFGPADFSFNRGKVHFVVMRDIRPDDGFDGNRNHAGFTDTQLKWLQGDLENVPGDWKVILSVHIPFKYEDKYNQKAVYDLISRFDGEVLSAHTHSNSYDPSIRNHIRCSVINTKKNEVNVCGDGSPKGITVFSFEDNRLVDERFVGLPSGMSDPDTQMRVCRGGLKFGGSHAFFQTASSRGDLFINVFNGDIRWKSVDVYEDGVKTGSAVLISDSQTRFTPFPLKAGETYMVPDGTAQDWWATGYIKGVYGYRTNSRQNYGSCSHLYHYSLQNPDAEVEVVATDPYGNTFRCSEIISDGTSYPSSLWED